MSGWAQREAERREDDDLRAALETCEAQNKSLAARAAALEEIIEGRTTPPTDDELAMHKKANGLWRVRWAYLNAGWDHVETDAARRLRDGINGKLRWWPIDAEGRPCVWPTVEVSHG